MQVKCFACQKYLADTTFEFDNWKKTDRLRKHSTSERHILAMTKWVDANKNKNNVLSKLNIKHTVEVAENRKHLKALIESVGFLAIQNIALRGHEESRDNLTESSTINRGNFLELLYLRSKDSPFLKERLEIQSKSKKFSKKWLSPSIQNELISLLSQFTLDKIMEEVKFQHGEESFFSIVCDETSDISRHEQVSLVICYMGKNGEKKEVS